MTNFIFFLIFITTVVVLSKIYSVIKKYFTIKKLRDKWGKLPETQTDLETAKLLFKLKNREESDKHYVLDNETWNDLNMDDFYHLANRTITPIGAQCLYEILRKPLLSDEELEKREDIIKTFAGNTGLREKIQVAFLPLSRYNVKFLVYSIWTQLPAKPKYTFIFYWLTAAAFWVLFLGLGGFIHPGFIFLMFVINSLIVFAHWNRFKQFLATFQYLAVLINTSGKIKSVINEEFPFISSQFDKDLKNTRSIAQNIFSLQFGDDNSIAPYFNAYFLLQLTGFYSALDKIKSNINELRSLFDIVGYLDALISIASYREQFPFFVNPTFVKDQDNFIVKEIYHPLLVSPVANDFIFESKNILITGSNMAGKSTFLKTIGINAVLAQTVNLCTAKKYEAPFIKVITSIERSDDLISGKSYYLAEVESILKVITASQNHGIHLFIIDEIFRGTNSVERTAASIEVLKYLVNKKDYIILGTHDLQLTETSEIDYRNYHFREEITDAGLHFDYKLHSGVSKSKNAIALLGFVGYPDTIVEGAKNLIKNNSRK